MSEDLKVVKLPGIAPVDPNNAQGVKSLGKFFDGLSSSYTNDPELENAKMVFVGMAEATLPDGTKTFFDMRYNCERGEDARLHMIAQHRALNKFLG